MAIKRLFLLFSGILTLSTLSQEREAKHEKWQELLGSGDFAVRNATMVEVWNDGREALGFLNKLIEGDDPELVARATTIIRQVKLGITPETPEKVINLIEQYFGATAKTRIDVIQRLLEEGEDDILLRLRSLENDPDVLSRIDNTIAKILPGIVRGHLIKGNIKLAKEDLALSHQFQHLVHYAHLCERTGDLDDEIERFSQSESEEDQARYLVCLRVKGDLAKLRENAKRLGDRDAGNIAALTMGDHVPYLESLLENNNPTLPNRHYLHWTLANHRGDREAEKKAFDALVYLSGQQSEQRGARVSLFRMGYGDVVLEGLEPSEFLSRAEYFLGQEDYLEAKELIGIADGEDFSDWLNEVSSRAKEEIEQTGASVELDRLVAAINFLEDRGLIENATQSALSLFDLVRLSSDLDLDSYASQIYLSAPISTYTAVSREIEEHGAKLGRFLERFRFRGRPDENLWLFNRLLEVYPDMSIRERLLLAMSFSSHRLLVGAAQFTEARDRMIELIADEEDRVGSPTNLLILLELRNREEDLLQVMAALDDAGSPNLLYEALIAMDGGRLEDAAKLLGKIETDPAIEVPEFLYQEGLLLKRTGGAGGDEMIERALLLSNGGALSLRSFAMEHLRYGEIKEAFELMSKALLRTDSSNGSAQFGIRNSLMRELAAEAVTLGRWQDVLAYKEILSVYSRYSNEVASGVFIMQNRFQILIARGALAMRKGDIVGAVASFSRAHEILPRHGYLANDLFPLLRELGLHELHDQLFAKTARDCRENIRLFPEDDNAYNNFAWLASRANRCLDEAEAYLKKALEMNPESAAYLDTMGEIYFARQNRAEAVAWSAKCLKNAALGNDSRWELQYQNLRFRSGGFPAR